MSDSPPTAGVNSEHKSESTSEYEYANDSMSSSSCCAATLPTLPLGLGLLRLLEPAAALPTAGGLVLLPELATRALVLLLPETEQGDPPTAGPGVRLPRRSLLAE